MSRAIEDLLHEHEEILFSLNLLDAIGQRVSRGTAVDLLAFIEFLKEFADKCHHGKEEGHRDGPRPASAVACFSGGHEGQVVGPANRPQPA